MKKIFFLLFTSLLLVNCTTPTPKEKKEYDQKMEDVLAAHDEVMPKMGTLSSLIEKTEAKLDTTSVGKTYKNANQDLKGAHDFMMEWMRDFGDKFPNALKDTTYTQEEYKKRLPKLEAEVKEVNEMKDAVNNSIEQAQNLLETNP
jgi:chromosome segregation ATPase